MRKIFILVFFLCFCCFGSHAQLKLGFRAGASYYKFSGPTEPSESFSFNNGFHFGITFNYYFTDIFSLRSDLTYSQNGTKMSFDGPSYYIFPIDGERFPAMDNITIEMDVSNAYISLPIMAVIKPFRRFEFQGGVYLNFLINPVGSGTLNFGGRFEQKMDLSFSGDEAGQYKTFPGARAIEVTILDEKRFLLPILGAYSFHETKEGNLFKGIDYGLTAGTSYYINPGFYLGLRLEYGLRDLTNNKMDRSLTEVNSDGSLIFRDDSDNSLGFQVSLGFRF